MEVLTPATEAEALAALSEPGTRAIAGGTALQVLWSQGVGEPDRLVRLDGLGLGGIAAEAGGLRIGATTTLAEVAASPLVRETAPLLSRAVRDVGAPGIRRLGTLGGQIGWGAGCLLPVLLTLGARVEVTRADGAGTEDLAMALTAPGGLVRAVILPGQPAGARWVWRKIGLREAFSPAIVTMAGWVADGAAALAVGGGPVPPQRLPRSEAALCASMDGRGLRGLIESEIDAPDCAFRSARYRRRAAAAVLAEALAGDGAQSAPRAAPMPRGTAPAGQRALDTDPAQADWHTRPDLPQKIAGAAGYLTDHRAPDMLVGRILRAGRPHARILGIDTAAAEAISGVRAVVTHRDVPGLNAFGIMWQDQPALCHDVVRHEGDPVAAVAAIDTETAEAALAAIQVVYDDLPAVTDPAAALEPDAAKVHATGNLASQCGLARGDAAAAMAQAAHVVAATYVTPRQMHGFLETEGGWVAPGADGTLTIAVGGQHGARDREQLARILALPEEKLRIVTSPIGGGFGGKDELTVQPALALLALKAGAPVRLHLSRAESVRAGVKRNPMRITMRTGCDAAGRLVAHQVDVIADCGAYASLSPAVLETGLEHAAGPYLVEHVTTRGRLAYTNNGTGGAFRGFGANQVTFAIECQMDRLAARLGLDPAEIRRRNLRRPGMPGFLGHRVAGSERLDEMLEAAAASPLWRPPSREGGRLCATGMALNYQGNGLGSLPHDEGEGRLRLREDGRLEIACGLDEMGQGLVTSLAAAVAAQLGCGRDDLDVVYGDTARAPDAGSTSASRGAFVAHQIATGAGPSFAAQLLSLAADALGTEAHALRIAPGGVAEAAQNSDTPRLGWAELARHAGPGGRPEARTAFAFPKTEYTKGNARFIHCFGATLARVAVDPLTGTVRVTDLHMHTAAGPVIDLAAYLGQIEGGMVQGLGFTLTEDAPYRDGRVVTGNLDTYAMPTIRDVPERMAVTALEALDPGDPWGPRGVGELGIGAVTPAAANAVAAALGRWPDTAPFCPETILDMLAEAA